jgi:hypothetical protein
MSCKEREPSRRPRLLQGSAAGEAAVEVVPVEEVGLAEEVAEIDDLAVALAVGVDEAAFGVFQFDAVLGEGGGGAAELGVEALGAVVVLFALERVRKEVAVPGGTSGVRFDRGLKSAEGDESVAQPLDDRDDLGEEGAGFGLAI